MSLVAVSVKLPHTVLPCEALFADRCSHCSALRRVHNKCDLISGALIKTGMIIETSPLNNMTVFILSDGIACTGQWADVALLG